MSQWKTIGSERLFDNSWLGLRRDAVITPGGTPDHYVVMEFKNRAVGIVPLTDDGQIVLVRQTRYAVGNISSLEIPKGGCPAGEDWLDTAHRELAEETGFRAAQMTVLMEGIHLSNSSTDEIGALFLASGLQPGQQALEDTEDIEVEYWPVASALQAVLDGRITDAMSVMAILLLVQQRSDE